MFPLFDKNEIYLLSTIQDKWKNVNKSGKIFTFVKIKYELIKTVSK